MRTLHSMSTLLVTSGFMDVMAAVVAGISLSMETSAVRLQLLKVRCTCRLEKTTIFFVTDTLKVTAMTFQKERYEWDSGLESVTRPTTALTPTPVGFLQ